MTITVDGKLRKEIQSLCVERRDKAIDRIEMQKWDKRVDSVIYCDSNEAQKIMDEALIEA